MPTHVHADESVIAADDFAGSGTNGDAGSRRVQFRARLCSGSIQSIPNASANVADAERSAAVHGAEYHAAGSLWITNAHVCRSMVTPAAAATATAAVPNQAEHWR